MTKTYFRVTSSNRNVSAEKCWVKTTSALGIGELVEKRSLSQEEGRTILELATIKGLENEWPPSRHPWLMPKRSQGDTACGVCLWRMDVSVGYLRRHIRGGNLVWYCRSPGELQHIVFKRTVGH